MIFGVVASADVPITITDTGTGISIGGGFSFTHTISPNGILTDADKPDLSGPNTSNPPGTTNSCGASLANGADKK